MKNVLVIKIQNVFGVQKIYPVNEQAKLFAQIAGTKTLTNVTLAYAERLGYSIVQEEAYNLEEVMS